MGTMPNAHHSDGPPPFIWGIGFPEGCYHNRLQFYGPEGRTFIPTPAIFLGSRLKSPSSTTIELIWMMCYITTFKEETAGRSDHPGELLGTPSGKSDWGPEPLGTMIEKTGVTDSECGRTPGRLFTLAIECKDFGLWHPMHGLQ